MKHRYGNKNGWDHQDYFKENQRFIIVFGLFLMFWVALAAFSLDDLKASDQVHFASQREFSPSQRDISLIVSDEGFYPESLVAFAGERVRFFVTATTKLPSCLIVEGKDLFVEAKNGEVRHGEVVFKRPGNYRFYCPKGQIHGNLTVLEHPERRRQQQRKREMASQKESREVKIWLPRDE